MPTIATFCLPLTFCLGANLALSDPSADPATLYAEAAWPAASADLHLRAWFPTGVRRLQPVQVHLEAYHDGQRSSRVRIEGVEVRAANQRIAQWDGALELQGDSGLYGEMVRLANLVPPHESKAYHHRTAPYEAYQAFETEEREGMLEELQILATQLAGRQTELPAMGLLPLTLPLDQLLDNKIGSMVELQIAVQYTAPDGQSATAELNHLLSRIADFPRLPLPVDGLGESPAVASRGTWYSGDLHMHHCKDEAGFWRGCPTCQAESTNFGDDNSLERLKTQYEALGADWFASTSHSYCLQKEEEYGRLSTTIADLNAMGGALILADTELTSAEAGERQGCADLNDLICLLPGGVNHTGAHFISDWRPGGTDLVGGYCFGPIFDILSNIANVRLDGGFMTINHPCPSQVFGGALTSNSDAVLTGMRAGGLTGAEIWNGKVQEDQNGHVGWWVKHLLRGKKLYCHSGSDTHDDAFDFGWTHVYAWPELSRNSLQRSLELGLSYVSSYQFLALAARKPGGRWFPMGADVSIAAGGGTQDVVVAIAYDMGERTGLVEVYRGRTGETEESLVAEFGDLSGSGNLFVSDGAPRDRNSYYRAYSVAPGSQPDKGVAYTNPIWFVPE